MTSLSIKACAACTASASWASKVPPSRTDAQSEGSNATCQSRTTYMLHELTQGSTTQGGNSLPLKRTATATVAILT
eukprot:3039831-Amphidinium_carterae.2